MSCCIKKMPSLLPDDTCHHIVMCLKPTYSSLTGILPCIYFFRLLRPLHCLYCFVLLCIFCVSTPRNTLPSQIPCLCKLTWPIKPDSDSDIWEAYICAF